MLVLLDRRHTVGILTKELSVSVCVVPHIKLGEEALLNAANEVAVEAFLDRRLNFLDIAVVIESVLANVAAVPADTLGAVLSADEAARVAARECVARCVSTTAGGSR